MKNFIITLPKKSNDPSGLLKDFLAKRIIKKYPWLSVDGIDKPYGFDGIQYAGPGDAFTFGASDTHDVSWIKNYLVPFVPKHKSFDLYEDFFSAIDALDTFAKSKKATKDIYDGMFFGKPYKVYDDFVQIGYDIIPRKRSYFNSLSEEKKTKITTIIIDINSYVY